jgi:hypothetical protein
MIKRVGQQVQTGDHTVKPAGKNKIAKTIQQAALSHIPISSNPFNLRKHITDIKNQRPVQKTQRAAFSIFSKFSRPDMQSPASDNRPAKKGRDRT